MFFKILQFFLFISFFVLKRCLQFMVKSNAGCNEFESNKVNCRMCLVQRENKTRKVKKTNRRKKMVEADTEIATLNKQKTVVRVR